MNKLREFFRFDEAHWQTLVVTYAAKFLFLVILLVIGFWSISRVLRVSNAFMSRRDFDNTLKCFFRNFTNILVKALFVLFVLNLVGIQTTSVLTIIGATSVAIGLALQGTLTNFAGGVMILLLRPFKIGDRLEAQGKKSRVAEIQLFNTVITNEDKKEFSFQTVYCRMEL